MPPLRAALALLPCLVLFSALAGACSSSGAPTLTSPEGNTSSDGAADVASPVKEGGSASAGDSAAQTNEDASNSEGDASTSAQDSATSSPTDANTNPSDDAPPFDGWGGFPDGSGFDAAEFCSPTNCDGPNVAPTCCAGDGTCVASSDTTCGNAGFPCVDCTATSQTCSASGVCQ